MQKYLLLPFLIAASFFYCTKDVPLPSGFENLDRSSMGKVEVKTLPLTDSAIFYQTKPAGTNNSLLLGQYEDAISFVAVKFRLTSPGNSTVSSARIVLNKNTHYGVGDPFDVIVNPITVSWNETSVTWKDLQSDFDANSIAAFSLNSIDSLSQSIDLPAEIVNDWIQNDAQNNGLLLRFEQASFLSDIKSSEFGSTGPTLVLVYQNQDSTTDTTSVLISEDASLIQFSSDEPEAEIMRQFDRLRVGNKSGYQALLKFDLSAIPEKVNIHLAELLMPVDTLSSETTDVMTIQLIPLEEEMTDWPATADDLKLASATLYEASARGDVSTTRIAITTLVQDYNLNRVNNGFLLRPKAFGLNVSEMYFFTGIDTSAVERPALKITYSLTPATRFEN